MLFYNHKKEFLGLNEEALQLLNYESMPELLKVASDVADLFANEPGYIHNFKHLSWIDFLLHADSDAKHAIVHGNNRVFSCDLAVKHFFTVESPDKPGFIVELLHAKILSGDEIKPFAAPSKPSVEAPKEVYTPEPSPSVLPDYGHITPTVLSEPSTFDIPVDEATSLDHMEKLYQTYPEPEKEFAPLPEIEDIYTEPVELTASVQPVSETMAPAAEPSSAGISFTPSEKTVIEQLKTPSSYQFDPAIAANELGLPVDLIEEFIGDFIQQSHDFKDELFEATLKGDFNNIKILSHKLKGVAANLRIEDAFEVLSIINTSSDITEVEACLKYFYMIVAKLEGKEASFSSTPSKNVGETFVPSSEVPAKTYAEEPSPIRTVSIDDDDIYDFGLKQDDSPSILVQEEELRNIEEKPFEEPSFEKTILEMNLAEEPQTLDPLMDEPVSKLHYDRAITAGSLGIDLMFFDELIEDYKKDAQNTLNSIIGAINAFDTHTWQHHAATLKGISDNLRLNEISQELAVLSVTNDAQEAKRASKHLKEFLAQL